MKSIAASLVLFTLSSQSVTYDANESMSQALQQALYFLGAESTVVEDGSDDEKDGFDTQQQAYFNAGLSALQVTCTKHWISEHSRVPGLLTGCTILATDHESIPEGTAVFPLLQLFKAAKAEPEIDFPTDTCRTRTCL